MPPPYPAQTARRVRALALTSLLALGCGADQPLEPAPAGEPSEPTRGARDASESYAEQGSSAALPVLDSGPSGQERSDAGRGDARVPSLPPSSSAADAGGPEAELESLRQRCVDEINRYRATLSLPPLARATDREACSDRGAQLDADSGRTHGSASIGGAQGTDGYCPRHAQNTCPGWPVGGRSGNATVADALEGCLRMMWNEGPPPGASCTGACFAAHGHYLNMSAPRTRRVACGFYEMRDGSWWMNQNFW